MNKRYAVDKNDTNWAWGRGYVVHQPDDPEAGGHLFETKAQADAYALEQNKEHERRELIREKHEWDNRMGDE